jgi:membrane protein YdbS with pleckstrin-like domain
MSTLYCINCGKNVPSKANFCPHCGAPQHGIEAGSFRASAPPVSLHAGATAVTAALTNKEKASADEFKNIENKKLASNAVWTFFVTYLLRTAIIPLLLIIIVIESPLISLIGFIVYIVLLFLFSELVYNNFHYSTDDVGFQKSFGVLHKMQVSIPYQQIQNVNIRRSLADRIFGLCHVSLETAGNSNGARTQVTSTSGTTSEGYLPGLTLEDAKYLHDLLLSRAQESD